MTINDRKILYAIESNLSNGKFVIFPFGKWGKRVKYLLNKKYGIKEIAIVDNCQSKKNDEIIGIKDVEKIGAKDYVVLFAVSNAEIYDELWTQAKVFKGKSVCDIASLECDNKFFSMRSDKLDIEECNSRQIETIFEMTRQTWSQLGSSQPYWSVLTNKRYLLENMGEKEMADFYDSGEGDLASIIQTLIRNDIIKDKNGAKSLDITEVGCGVGRVTKHLAQAFHKVTAIDVSAGNMEIASMMIREANVSFELYKCMEDYCRMPKADVVYSIIVLQHNVPPVIEYILQEMLKSLKIGGVALFQVPTYREAYEFKAEAYINGVHDDKMEMHVLPQKKIFEIAYVNGCIPMEVYQDQLSGQDDFSCTFVMKKIEDRSGR